MKNLIITFSILLLYSCCPYKTLPADQEPDLDKIVQTVQDQYRLAQDELEKKNIKVKITEAEVSLEVSKSLKSNAGIKILIIKPNASYSNTHSTKVSYKLTEAKDDSGGGNIIKNPTELKDMIVAAAENFNKVNTTIGTLTEKEFTLTITFAIEYEAGIGFEFEFWGMTAEGGGSKSKAVEHELTLTFKQK